MKAPKKLPFILMLGVVTLCVAWLMRQRILSVTTPAAPVLPIEAMPEPKVAALQNQIDQLRSAISQSPQDVSQRWALADAYQQLGELVLAATELKTILEIQPGNVDAKLALANVHLVMKQLKLAEAGYRDVIHAQPRNPDACRDLAVALYHQARFLEAIEVARKAVSLQPKEPNARYILATSLLEYGMQFPDTTMHVDKLMQARRELDNLTKIWSQNGDIYYRLGRACVGMRDGKSAIKYLRKAKTLLPNFLPVYSHLSQALLASGDRKAARAVVEEALEKNLRDARLLDLYGQILQISTDAETVQRMFEAHKKAVELEPDNPAYQERFAVACLRLGKIDEAQVGFERALLLNPVRSFPYQQLAAIYTRKGMADKATQAANTSTAMVYNDQQLKRIMSLGKVYPRDVRLHLILAERFTQLGAYGLARDEYLLVQRLEPGNKRAREGMANLIKKAAHNQNIGAHQHGVVSETAPK